MVIGIILIFIVGIIGLRLTAGNFDTDRIEEEIRTNGGKLISKEWSPFGKGWIGEKYNRIYKVVYLDKDDNTHEAFVKTSMLSGVYFTQDKIVKQKDNQNTDSDISKNENEVLKLENEKLRNELENLKKQKY